MDTEKGERRRRCTGTLASNRTPASGTPGRFVRLRATEGIADVRTEQGGELQVPLPQDLVEAVEAGGRVVLYFGPASQLLGWYAPEGHVGLDLRRR